MAVAQRTAQAIALPFREAVDFFAGKTNVTTEHWTDVWRTGHTRAFMVAGAATEALVEDFRQSVARAIEQGTTLADFRRDFDAIVARHGWVHNGKPGWRAEIIYDTNLSMAFAAGRHAQQSRPEVLAAFPFWEYRHSGALHPRKQHLLWNGLVLRADDPFWATHYPPNGWRCGCRVRPRSARDLARAGKSGPDEAPTIRTREWTNPRTGATSRVPEGIDPGFDYNPGQAWQGGAPAIPGNATMAPPPGWMPEAPALPRASTPRPARPAAADDTDALDPLLPVNPTDFDPGPADLPLPPIVEEERRRVDSVLAPLRRRVRELLGDAGLERLRDAGLDRLREAIRGEERRLRLLDRLRREQGDAAADAARDLDGVELLLLLQGGGSPRRGAPGGRR